MDLIHLSLTDTIGKKILINNWHGLSNLCIRHVEMTNYNMPDMLNCPKGQESIEPFLFLGSDICNWTVLENDFVNIIICNVYALHT